VGGYCGMPMTSAAMLPGDGSIHSNTRYRNRTSLFPVFAVPALVFCVTCLGCGAVVAMVYNGELV